MAKTSKLNNAKAKVIEEEILKESPEGMPAELPDDYAEKVAVCSEVPEMRHFIFINSRDPGVPLEFHYHSATWPLKQYKLLHGKEYDLPAEIVDWLESRNEPVTAYRTGPDGLPELYVKSRKYIFQCRATPKAA